MYDGKSDRGIDFLDAGLKECGIRIEECEIKIQKF